MMHISIKMPGIVETLENIQLKNIKTNMFISKSKTIKSRSRRSMHAAPTYHYRCIIDSYPNDLASKNFELVKHVDEEGCLKIFSTSFICLSDNWI